MKSPPRLDDRSFRDLVEEVIARVPAHTPEWSHVRVGDPGRTLLELFAWLTDTLLYRANLIPERQRLVFLRLLGIDLRPASPATTVVGVCFDDEKADRPVMIKSLASLKGPVPFETRSELTILPITAEGYYKRPLTAAESAKMAELLAGLSSVYLKSGEKPAYYATTPVFPAGAADPRGFDLVSQAVDHCLWLALLAPKKKKGSDWIEKAFAGGPSGNRPLLSVGVSPSIEVPALFEDIGPRGRIPHVFEISGPDGDDHLPVYHTLSVASDTTGGLTRRGVIRLVLPSPDQIAAPTNDVRQALHAGVGDRPPRLDDVEKAERLVAWLRIRPTERLARLSLSWVGIHAVEVDQRQTVIGRVAGASDGTGNQQMSLFARSVEPESLQIEVEEPGQGYQRWHLIDDLVFASRDEARFSLDSEAGEIRFGDGMRGRIPATGMRVRVAQMRAGGGAAGNLPPGTLKEIAATAIDGKPLPKLKVVQSLPALGGQDAETLAEAERRIPAILRHGQRAVTMEDFQRIATDTPGVQVGRVDVLPRFKPHQRRDNVPGVVTVMVLPFSAAFHAPNPRPDRPFLESVHAHLDARRPLATELYVIGCEYVPLGIGVGITVREGFGRDAVTHAVREALYRYLWTLAPGGPLGAGWPLNKVVRDRELEVAVAQVPGVDTIAGVNLFSSGMITRIPIIAGQGGKVPPGAGFTVDSRPDAAPKGALPAAAELRPKWVALTAPSESMPVNLILRPWQLPELLGVVVGDGVVPTDMKGIAPDPFAGDVGVAVPVVPEVC
jgi:predicted phage baseplate assembly protein